MIKTGSQNFKLTYSIKYEIILHALHLMFYNTLLWHRNDKQYYLYAVIGTLLAIIPMRTNNRYYAGNILTFLLFFKNTPFLFYPLYGYILTSSYQSVAIICLSTTTQCIFTLRRIEMVSLLLPCLFELKMGFIALYINILLLGIIMFFSPPAIEIKDNDRTSLLQKFNMRINILIAEDDFILIAEEHKKVIDYYFAGEIDRTWHARSVFDMLTPLVLLNLPVLMCSWVFISYALSFFESFYANFVFYLFLILDKKVLIFFFSIFCSWKFKICQESKRIALMMTFRVITGYLVYLIISNYFSESNPELL